MDDSKMWLGATFPSQDLTQDVEVEDLQFKFDSNGVWQGPWVYDFIGEKVVAPISPKTVRELLRYMNLMYGGDTARKESIAGIQKLVSTGKVVVLDPNTGHPLSLIVELEGVVTDIRGMEIVKYLFLIQQISQLLNKSMTPPES